MPGTRKSVDEMSNAYTLFCVFADDVRLEANGKQFVIGMYQGGMNFASNLPATLPQFHILAHLLVPPTAERIEKLQILVEHAGKTLIDVTPPIEELRANLEEHRDEATGDPHVLQMSLGLVPFHVERVGKLTVKAIINHGIVAQGNSLTIRHGPATTTVAAS